MKKIIIILAVIALLFFGGLIYAARNIDRIIAAAKPAIESSLAQALEGKLTIGDIKTTVFPETAVQINALAISDSPLIPEMLINSIALKVSFASLLKGNLNVHELTIQNPKIIFPSNNTKNQNPHPPVQKTDRADKNSQANAESALADLPIVFNLQRFSIEKGEISLPDAPMIVNNLEVNSGAKFANGVASVERLKIVGNFASKPMLIEVAQGSFNLQSEQLQMGGALIDIAGVRTNLDANLNRRSLTGDSSVTVSAGSLSAFFEALKTFKPDFTVPPFDITNVSVPIKISAEGKKFNAESNDAKFALNNSAVSTQFALQGTEDRVNASSLLISAFGGSVESPLTLEIPQSEIKLPITIKQIGIEPALNALAPKLPVKLFGTLDNFSGTFETSFKTNIMTAASGNGAFSLSNGGIRGINILGKIIDALANIPILGYALHTKLAPSVLAVARSEDTTFKTLSGKLSVNKGVAALSSIQLDSDLFHATSSGSLNLVDQSMNLNVIANLKPELVNNLIAAGKDFGKVANPDGTITVPLIIKKSADGMQVIPDVDKLAKGAAGKVLKEQASKALQKALGEKNSGIAEGVGKLLGF